MRTIRYGIFSTQYIKEVFLFSCLIAGISSTKAQEVKLYTGCNVVLSGSVYVVMNNTAFKNNGTFTAGASTVVFSGNTDTTISYLSGTSNTTFNNLTLNKTAYGTAIKSWAGVKNVFTLTAGSFYSNGNLTLLSDASNTARLAAVPSTGAYIYGNTLVERYIPSKRAWRLMTGPVTNGATIYNSWQNAGVYTVGKGLLISGPGAANGLDNGNAYSLKKWSVASQSLIPVTNTNVSISASNNGSADNTGYFVFIRGDRNTDNFAIPNTNITTLTTIGKLQTGAQTFTAATNAGDFTLIGNPYASPIDFNLVTRSNLLKRFYVWDPTLNSLGGYVTIDDLDNDGVYSKSVSASAQTKEIQSSQAFFVETAAAGASSITIDESAKSVTNNTNVFRPLGTGTFSAGKASLRANIYLLNTDSLILADGALTEFGPGFTDDVTNEDAIKFTNINETIGFARHSATLAIERRPVINNDDTLFVKLSRTTQRNYQLQLVPENIDQPGLTAFLEDSYLATSTPISLAATISTNFTIDANAASAAADRFRIVFKQLNVLPVTITNVKAYHFNDDIKVDWRMQDENGIVKYEVEKSANGKDFKSTNASDVNTTGSYSWVDEQPFSGKNFYRIKTISRDGGIKYSTVVNVLMEIKATHFTIYPNPVKGNSLHLEFANKPAGNYQFNLSNSMGQLMFSKQITIASGSTSQELKSDIMLPTGLYQLQINGPDNSSETKKVIIKQ